VTAIFNKLVTDGVVPRGTCTPPGTATPTNLQWKYAITGCPDELDVTINRGWAQATSAPTYTVGTQVTVAYPYHWRFNSAIQLLFPGVSFGTPVTITETATVHNQM
jgi:hypothetical protein